MRVRSRRTFWLCISFYSFVAISPPAHAQTWQAFTSLAVSTDGMRFSTGGQQGELRIWNLSRGEPEATLSIGESTISATTWKGSSCLAVTLDGNAARYDVETGELVVRSISDRPLRSLAVTGNSVFVVGDLPIVHVLDLSAWGVARTIRTTHQNAVKSVVTSPDGRSLATCSDDGSVEIRRVDDGRLGARWAASRDWVRQVFWNENGIWTICDENQVELWTQEGKPVMSWHLAQRPTAIAVDGRTWLVGTSSGDVLWGAFQDPSVRKFPLHEAPVSAVSFVFQKPTIVSASLDFRICLFDTSKATTIGEISLR